METLRYKVLDVPIYKGAVEDSDALRLLTLRDIYYMCLVQGDTA